MRLRIPLNKLTYWADRYIYDLSETALMDAKNQVLAQGYLTKQQLRDVCHWKSPRPARHVRKNEESYVREITGFCLNAKDERARIEPLTGLNGVSWPSASVILHLFHIDKYPILDFRALWSLNEEVPSSYGFEFWMNYVNCTRDLARESNLSMRIIDRALWQYSKKNQP